MRLVSLRLLLGLTGGLAAAPSPVHAQSPGSCAPGTAYQALQIGGTQAALGNNGNLFFRNGHGFYNVPRTASGAPIAVFASGFWMGGYVGTELRQAVATYGPFEFWPGPLDAGGALPPGGCAAFDRIYRVTADDLPTAAFPSRGSTDLREWPVGLGAPAFVDANGNFRFDAGEARVVPSSRTQVLNRAAGELPLITGHETAFWVMNDVGNTHARTNSAPLGLEVRVTASAFRSSDPTLDLATTYRVEMVYKGTQPLTDAVVGFWSDPDLGNAQDDYVGSDSLLGLAYTYNADNFDEGTGSDGTGYGAAPPAIGYTVLEGQAGLGMVYYTNGPDAVTGDPTGDDYYDYLRGRWRDGRPIRGCANGDPAASTIAAFPDACQPTRWMFAGDPVAGTGHTERTPITTTTPNAPGDRRFLFTTTPRTFQPGESHATTFAIVYARGTSNLNSVTRLKQAVTGLRQVYAQTGFVNLPDRGAAPEPTATVAPLSPANGAEEQPANPVLQWEPVEGAQGYRIDVTRLKSDGSPDSTDTWYVYNGASLRIDRFDPYLSGAPDQGSRRMPAGEGPAPARAAGPSEAALQPIPEALYEWRVSVLNVDNENGPLSAPRRFTVSQPALAAGGYLNFLVTRNAAGALTPPDYGALDVNFRGFPRVAGTTQAESGVSGRNQSTNASVWGVHTTDTDGADEGFASFTARTLRDGANLQALRGHAYEWRFTAAGGKALDALDGGTPLAIDVPFELWDAGTRADASDDVRLLPLIHPIDGGQRGVFDIGADHPTSSAANDPQTDAVHWHRPVNEAPGQGGYEAWAAAVTANPAAPAPIGEEVMARTVLVSFNGGTVPGGPFNAALPETGTVFRIETSAVSAPVIAAPLDGATLESTQAALFWNEPPLTPRRRAVQLALDAGFQSVVRSDSSATGASLSVAGLAPSTTYHWRVRIEVGPGLWVTSEAASFTTGLTTDAEAAADRPSRLTVDAPYPNPARGDVRVRVGMAEAGEARVEVFDVLGRRVARLPAEIYAAGWHVLSVPTGAVAPGVYVIRVETGDRSATQMVTVLR